MTACWGWGWGWSMTDEHPRVTLRWGRTQSPALSWEETQPVLLLLHSLGFVSQAQHRPRTDKVTFTGLTAQDPGRGNPSHYHPSCVPGGPPSLSCCPKCPKSCPSSSAWGHTWTGLPRERWGPPAGTTIAQPPPAASGSTRCFLWDDEPGRLSCGWWSAVIPGSS